MCRSACLLKTAGSALPLWCTFIVRLSIWNLPRWNWWHFLALIFLFLSFIWFRLKGSQQCVSSPGCFVGLGVGNFLVSCSFPLGCSITGSWNTPVHLGRVFNYTYTHTHFKLLSWPGFDICIKAGLVLAVPRTDNSTVSLELFFRTHT